MHWVGFEPTIPGSERAKTVHALDWHSSWYTRIYLNGRDDSSVSRFFNKQNNKTVLKYFLSCLSSNQGAPKLTDILIGSITLRKFYLLWIPIPYVSGKPFKSQNTAVMMFIPNHVPLFKPTDILQDWKFRVMEDSHCFTLRNMFILTGQKFIMEFLKALYILGLFLFLLYINHLPLSIISVSTPVLFVDDTSMIITAPDVSQLAESAHHILTVINKWFTANKTT
jgi:hypothetical protein